MSKNLDPDFPEKGIVPYSQNSESRPVPQPNPQTSDLEVINQVIAERIRRAETFSEVEDLVKLLPYIEKQKESRIKQELTLFKIEQSQKQADFNRKIAERKELSKIVASLAGVGVGLYLMPSAPLFAPLLIILGLASPLQYSLREVANLWESMINSTKDAASELFPIDETKSNRPENSDF